MDDYHLTYLDNEGQPQSVTVTGPTDARDAQTLRTLLGGHDFTLIRRTTNGTNTAIPLD